MLLDRLPPSLVSLVLLTLLRPFPSTLARRLSLPAELDISDLSPRQDNPLDAVWPTDLATDIGMIFPADNETLYAGRKISVGFADPVSQDNTLIAGVFRLVTPVLTYSNRTSITLDPWGTLDMTPPPSSYYPPVPRQGWCSVTLYPNDVHIRDFLIPQGLENDEVRFTLNVTWGLPSYNGKDKTTNCTNPAQLYRTYFASHLLPISSIPLSASPNVPLFSPAPPPVSLTTVFGPLSTLLPPSVPVKIDHSDDAEKRNFAIMGALLGIGAVLVMFVIYWAARRKRRLGRGQRAPGDDEEYWEGDGQRS